MSERDIFLAALDLPEAERPRFITEQCGADADLQRRVEALFAAHAAAGGFLDSSPGAFDSTRSFADARLTAVPDNPRSQPTAMVAAGQYKLIEQIGEGGMGSVWLAEQSEPVKRKVAIKFLKPGLDTKQVLARFEAERQALALMDHPNIAKVLDAGLHDNRPFFVMELVKGIPITDFCDARRLTLRERLELFVPVCQAIQHAHQKGIVHRDIKPANVLVALYDDKPIPKVIDFGMVKAIGPTLTEHTLNTGFGTIVGTPQYMSPEQATFNNVDIDTRTDVYSLGVLLYELLAGSPPFQAKELGKKGLLEILRVVREEEPPRPSIRLSTADALPDLSANRGTEPKKLTGLLRNDLDWIVMKALEKDRGRRYDSASGFATDVQRYLSGEPVHAHPPSAAYRLRKFVRKNRGPVLAGAAVFLALLLGIAGTTFGLIRAEEATRRETERADGERAAKEEVREQKERAERAAVAERQAKEREIENGVLIQAQRNQLETALDEQRELLTDYGVLLLKVNRRDEALALFRKADAIMERLAAAFPETPRYRFGVARAVNRTANGLFAQGQHEEAEGQYKRALTLRLGLLAEAPTDRSSLEELIAARVNLALLLEARGKLNEASGQWTDSLTSVERLIALFPTEHKYRSQLGGQFVWLGELSDKREEWAESVTLYDKGIQEIAAAIASDPRLEGDLLSLARAYRQRAEVHLRRNRTEAASADFAHAADAALRFAARKGNSVAERYSTAVILTQASDQLPTRADTLAGRAVDLLREASQSGNYTEDIRHAKNLDPLRGRDDFKKLLADLEAKFPPKKE